VIPFAGSELGIAARLLIITLVFNHITLQDSHHVVQYSHHVNPFVKDVGTSRIEPRINRTRKKSKAGCKTCKIRRLKVGRHPDKVVHVSLADNLQCDETHPVYGNCKLYYSNRIESCEYDCGAPQRKKSKAPSTKASSSRDSSAPEDHVLSLYLQEPFPQGRTLFPKTIGTLTLDPFGAQPKSKLPKADQLLYFCMSPFLTIELLLSIQSLH
jgi:hypothetical protein